MITKANEKNIPMIMEVLKDTIKNMNENGLYQWNESYPNIDVITTDMNNDELFVYIDENEVVKGFIVLNQREDKDYSELTWENNNGKNLVIHRLCVSPKYQGNGVAKSIMSFSEEHARENGYGAIRLDTAVNNEKAIRFYEKLGYNKTGVVTTEKGGYVCFEKLV